MAADRGRHGVAPGGEHDARLTGEACHCILPHAHVRDDAGAEADVPALVAQDELDAAAQAG